MSVPLNEPADQVDELPPVTPWAGYEQVALPPELRPATLQRLADLLGGRLDEQRGRMDVLSTSHNDLHLRVLDLAGAYARVLDRCAELERSHRAAQERLQFLSEAYATLEARIADLEDGRAV